MMIANVKYFSGKEKPNNRYFANKKIKLSNINGKADFAGAFSAKQAGGSSATAENGT